MLDRLRIGRLGADNGLEDPVNGGVRVVAGVNLYGVGCRDSNYCSSSFIMSGMSKFVLNAIRISLLTSTGFLSSVTWLCPMLHCTSLLRLITWL